MARRIRIAFIAAALLGSVWIGTAAIPASGATTLVECSGFCGDWAIKDSKDGPQGATCSYEKVSRELNRIAVKPPRMWDDELTNKVEWRFVVRRSVGGGPYTTVYNSPKQSVSVGSGESASNGHGFSVMKWNAPEDPAGNYLVWVEMQWTLLGIASGMARAEIDWYRSAWNGTATVRHNRCPWRTPAS